MGVFLRKERILCTQSCSSTWKRSEPEEKDGNTVGSPAGDGKEKQRKRRALIQSQMLILSPTKFQSVL